MACKRSGVRLPLAPPIPLYLIDGAKLVLAYLRCTTCFKSVHDNLLDFRIWPSAAPLLVAHRCVPLGTVKSSGKVTNLEKIIWFKPSHVLIARHKTFMTIEAGLGFDPKRKQP